MDDNRTEGTPSWSGCGGMTPGQERALEAAAGGTGNVFITGSAGSGKSTVIRKIMETLQAMGKSVLACAPTGLAAMNMERGMTVHAAFGFPPDSCIVDGGPGEGMRLRVGTPKLVRAADVLLVDEVSMASPDLLDSVILSLRKAGDDAGRPKRLIVVGDFCQLNPVLPRGDARRGLLESFYGARHDNWYAFMGRFWDESHFSTVFLTEAVRQKDAAFVRCLEQVRRGDPSCLEYLNTAALKTPEDGAVSLFARNQKVNECNRASLESLGGEASTYRTAFQYEPEFQGNELACRAVAGIPGELSFKAGVQVLFTATDYNGACSSRVSQAPRRGTRPSGKPNFVNGMTGTILEIRKESVVVKTESGDTLEVSPMTRPLYTYLVDSRRLVSRKVASYTQYPFILAYALTIHRAQGQTLSRVVVDPDTFAPGQLYVALSRVTSLDGLCLTRPIKPDDLKVDPAVLRFYERAEKMAGISRKRGRPVTNTDGTGRSRLIWVPKGLEQFVREEVRQNRLLELKGRPEPLPGRAHIRVTEELYGGIRAQIQAWRGAPGE